MYNFMQVAHLNFDYTSSSFVLISDYYTHLLFSSLFGMYCKIKCPVTSFKPMNPRRKWIFLDSLFTPKAGLQVFTGRARRAEVTI